MEKRSIILFSLIAYVILIPLVILHINTYIEYFSFLSVCFLIGIVFGFFKSMIVDLIKLNGKKFPHLEDKKKVIDNPDFNTIPKGVTILTKEQIEKYRKQGAKLRGEEYKEVVEHKQFHPSDLTPTQQERFDKWKSELPTPRTREDGNFYYIYSCSGIGWSLTLRRGKTNKYEIDLTEYETW